MCFFLERRSKVHDSADLRGVRKDGGDVNKEGNKEGRKERHERRKEGKKLTPDSPISF